MRNASLKLLVLTLVGLFLTNCQRDDAPEVLPQEEPVPTVDPQAVVSLNEAKSLFEASENQKRTTNSVSRSNYPLIELETDWRYFEQMKDLEEMPYAKVPVRISRTELNGEVLFLKKDGKTEQYLFLPQIDSIRADRRIINAEFYLLDTKGVFLSAYRMTDGVITHKIVPKRKGSYRIIENNESSVTARSGKPICVSCRFIITPPPIFSPGKEPNEREDDGDGGGGGNNYFVLEPVTVYGKFTKKSRNNSDFPHYTYYDYSPYNYGDFYDDRDSDDTRKLREKRSAGGGGSSSNIGAGMAKEKEKKEEKKQDKREDTIKDSLTTPCAKALLAQAPTLANDIATLLNKTFGTNKNIDITIYNKPFTDKSLVDSDAYSMLAKDVITDGEHHIDVYVHLNDNVLKTATQEYILATIYHEVLHGFLDVERQVLGEQVFHQKYPSVEEVKLPIGNGQRVKKYKLIQKQDHDKFAPYIESLAQSIMSLPNSKISLKTARAMAKVGIVEGSSLSDEEKLINQGQRNGTDPTGIKCP
ncbi:hypothetical protein [Capnocytophaga endodontalis]|uniref:Uncharacterized protein n=1 Tax=Capnocytophaga endodontalis TaxID=2708117 RepID=A0A1Z4BT93_9FLAO|nr:hypothetical protein [Capnocytophaga endodontalis]ASF44429.1 hypothetical protein CBG49_00110 [Capnocytophaga endodontalis]